MVWGSAASGHDDAVKEWVSRLERNDPSFTSLNILSFRKLSSDQFVKVFDALASNGTVKELCTSGHRHWPDMLTSLARSLQSNTTLEFLSVGNSDMGDKGLAHLTPGIHEHPSLKKIDLEYKGLTDEIAAECCKRLVSPPSLHALVVARNELSDKFAQALATGLASLNEERPVSVAHLDLSYNKIQDTGLSALASYLATAHSSHLKRLYLNHNQIAGPGITDLGASLKDNSGLEELHVRGFQIPVDAAAALGEGLTANGSLRRVDIGECGLTPDHARAMAQTNDNGAQIGIAEVVFTANHDLGDDGVVALVPVLTDATHVDFEQVGLTIAGLRELKALSAVKNLSVFGNPGLSSASRDDFESILRSPQVWPDLQELNLGGCKLARETLSHILDVLSDPAILPNLTELAVGGNEVTPDDEEWLADVAKFGEARENVHLLWKVSAHNARDDMPDV